MPINLHLRIQISSTYEKYYYYYYYLNYLQKLTQQRVD